MTAYTRMPAMARNYDPGFQPTRPQEFMYAILTGSYFQCRTGLTALAGGGRPTTDGAQQLDYGYNEVAVVATSADSVLLPPAVAGAFVFVDNIGAASMTVFAIGSDTINTTAGATGVAQSNGVNGLYFCPIVGKWRKISAST